MQGREQRSLGVSPPFKSVCAEKTTDGSGESVLEDGYRKGAVLSRKQSGKKPPDKG
ncbi:hypothetical protein GJ744_002097 [Endocarpon pusillum]|uniref:Uncharacterized protein n=1 Tax=Endocarpon pusillum TaxID=364733 RepID=A0A8H7ACD3_9EURO|nr:hypothetical protein GJ744_002097 [Endocarpon pusillum]